MSSDDSQTTTEGRPVRELAPGTVERIAAGEVVTRPAAVVRELIENALDAGATSVEVAVEDSGRGLLRVADDGHGMSEADALLAVERHTTSKLSSADDLSRVDTLGFRGEALPSVASVSRFALTTRAPDREAVKVVVDDAGAKRAEPAARGVGTTVEARDLFYNRPARAESLASPRREFARVSRCVTDYALAHPDVRFRLDHDGRSVLSTPGSGDPTDAVLGTYDRTAASESTTVDGGDDAASVAGLVTYPSVTRASPDHVHVSVNGRPVDAPALRRAVVEGYGSLLPDGRYPVAVANVTVSPATVDQNVHPAKREVALHDADAVAGAVGDAVRAALSTSDLTRTGEVALDLESSLAPLSGESTFDRLGVIGQYRGLYLLCEADGDLLVVDQHAAHERINYERFRETVSGGVPSADLDPAATVTLSADEAAAVEDHRAALEQAGYRLAPFGGRTYRIQAVPAPLGRVAAPESIHDALDALRAGGRDPRDDLLADLACHPSLKAGDDLSPEAATALVERLGQCDQPYACPHGRPTVLSIDEATLVRGFERENTRL
ncbi:MAG: DNA mismatch repair endonuclease MutL [Haloarculaceae archaeon]